jgi:hypothetical protein
MKVLFVPEWFYVIWRKERGNTIDFDRLNYLADYPNTTILYSRIYLSPADGPMFSDFFESIKSFRPDIIVIIESCCPTREWSWDGMFAIAGEMHIPVVLFIDDYFYTNRVKQSFYYPRVDGIYLTTRHAKCLAEFKKDKPTRELLYPYINTTYFHDWGMPKKYDILLYGMAHSLKIKKDQYNVCTNEYFDSRGIFPYPDEYDFYPFRKRLFELLLKQTRFNVYYIPQTPQGGNNCPVRTSELSKLINQSYLSVATPSIMGKAMTKYWEILASGSIILGEVPVDYKPELSDWIVKVSIDMTDAQILDIIDVQLNDRLRLKEAGKNASKLICSLYGCDSSLSREYFYKNLHELKDEISNK